MKSADLFESLVQNGLDFLKSAIADFQKKPKYSVINFYSALELFLKARLMAEHWSLIVAKDPDRSRFEAGDFVSVAFEEAIRRLDKIVGSQIQDNAVKAFDTVRKHRNQMVHFFHASQNDKNTIEKIAAEQLSAWYELNQLMLTHWAKIFEKYKDEFLKIEEDLNDHRKYLEAKFNALKQKIGKEKKAGVQFVECQSCHFAAGRVSVLIGDLHRASCLVCNRVHDWLDITCPTCGVVTPFEGSDRWECENGHQLSEGDLIDLLDEDKSDPYSGEVSFTPANCGNCDGFHTVITYKDEYVCISCLDHSEGIEVCGWCNEGNSGDMEDSFWAGCNQCSGNMGHQRDD